MRKLFIIALFLTPLAHGAGLTDYIGTVTASVTDLVTGAAPVFLTFGNQLLTSLGIIMLVIYGLKWATHSAARHHGAFDFPGLVQFFGLFLVAEALLRYYNVPLPWSGTSFHQLLPNTGQQLAAAIDVSTLDTLTSRVTAIVNGTERPSIFNPLELMSFMGIFIDMLLIEGLLFGVTILGFIAVGIGSIMGPLFVPWLIIPRFSWLFWNWISFMLQYSFYQVVASALVYVWTHVLVTFIDSAIHGDYTLAHFLVMLVPLGMLNVGMLFSVIKITSFCSDLFKGSAVKGSFA
jgi:type IV secretory pathway VirB6-like protein